MTNERLQIIAKMQAAGLIEPLAWPRPSAVSDAEQARLAHLFSIGRPLSEIIIADRGQPTESPPPHRGLANV